MLLTDCVYRLMKPLRVTHAAFRSGMTSHLGIYAIPPELRKVTGLDPLDAADAAGAATATATPTP